MASLGLWAGISTLYPLWRLPPTSSLWLLGPARCCSPLGLARRRVFLWPQGLDRKQPRIAWTAFWLFPNCSGSYCYVRCILGWCVCYKFGSWRPILSKRKWRNCRSWLGIEHWFTFPQGLRFQRKLLKLREGLSVFQKRLYSRRVLSFQPRLAILGYNRFHQIWCFGFSCASQ